MKYCEISFPSCSLNLSQHISQIITGFMMLERQKQIKLRISIKPELKTEFMQDSIVEVKLDGLRIIYDATDGYQLFKDIRQLDKILDNVDFYFKRSYKSEYHQNFKNKDKIYPLGLNYHVTIDKNPLYDLKGKDDLKSKFIKLIRMFPYGKYSYRHIYPHCFEMEPILPDNKRILFLCRAWNPDEIVKSSSENARAEKEQIVKLNEMRADCIRRLKEEYGEKFVGGFSANTYIPENCSDCVVQNVPTNRTSFLQFVKDSYICVATTGLFGSIGWKFGEYIAASRAIVSEKLFYELPGDFSENKNYLAFSSADECVKQVGILMDNEQLGLKMMQENAKYYNDFVKPDMLVKNTLSVSEKVKV